MELKTEEEVRKIYFDAFDNVEITVKEQLKAETEFKGLVDNYLNVRGHLDPEWESVPFTGDTNEDTEFDFYGESITIEWRETDRCGDSNYFRREFPLSDLWQSDLESFILAQVKDKKEKKEAKRVAELAKAAANIEKIERNRLEELLNKYGVPDSWKNK